MNILELQHEDTTEGTAHNTKSISQLNSNVLEMDQCTVPDNDGNYCGSTGFKEMKKRMDMTRLGRIKTFLKLSKKKKIKE